MFHVVGLSLTCILDNKSLYYDSPTSHSLIELNAQQRVARPKSKKSIIPAFLHAHAFLKDMHVRAFFALSPVRILGLASLPGQYHNPLPSPSAPPKIKFR